MHLLKRRPAIDSFDLDSLASASEGYVGAEIEQAIIDAMLSGYNDGHREFTMKDIMNALKEIVPISRSQKDNIEILREWLKDGRARSASFQDKIAAMKEQVKIPDYGAAPALEVGN